VSPEATGRRSQPAQDPAQDRAVPAHDRADDRADDRVDLRPEDHAERLAREFARAWGQMGPLWAVPPALARVHGYLLARREALPEREIREALGLSHRAASLALSECATWGLVRQVEGRRSGRRGPAGMAYQAIPDHWRWLRDLVARRKLREADPVVEFLRRTVAEAETEAATHPADVELAALRDWLAGFLDFVELVARALSLIPDLEPRELEHVMRVFGRLPERTVLRLFRLLTDIPEEDAIALVGGLSQLSPAALRRVAGLVRALPGER
jgi:DNA-binding transcriptional regulator GbsR (MarR family)